MHTKYCIKNNFDKLVDKTNYIVFRDFNSNCNIELNSEFNNNALAEHNIFANKDIDTYKIFWLVDSTHDIWLKKIYKNQIVNYMESLIHDQKGGHSKNDASRYKYLKYLKYKCKYLKSKNNIMFGASPKVIIHISGPSGAGKTTLGNKLKEQFGDKIIVKDTDDLRAEFVGERYGGYTKLWNIKNFVWDNEAYQKYIDNYIKQQTKPLIFVGLNHMPWWNKKLYYNMHSNYNFYIKMDSDNIFEQKCNRYINDIFVDKREKIIKDIMKNEDDTIKDLQEGLKNECGYKEITDMNNIWNEDYKEQEYKFMSRENIFDEVSKILQKNI